MFKKCNLITLALILFIVISVPAVHSAQTMDTEQLNNGIIGINYQPANNILTKVMISKGDAKYTYNLTENNKFPLQFGSGEYTISILEKITGNRYRVVKKEQVSANLSNNKAVYLQSIQNINWNENMEVIKKAKELTANATTDQDKVAAIYDYVTHNISYDYTKANNVSANYLPSIEEIDQIKTGICYDYSSVTAAMLRSVGVPTKMLMGYKNDIGSYHAWNQVYLQESNSWITVDTTYDALYIKNNIAVEMKKDPNDYSVVKEY